MYLIKSRVVFKSEMTVAEFFERFPQFRDKFSCFLTKFCSSDTVIISDENGKIYIDFKSSQVPTEKCS